MLKELKGTNGQLELYEDKVILRRKGFMAKIYQGFTAGDKTIPISHITGIDFKGAGFTVGYIQFTMGGSNEGTRGVSQALRDENTITFTLKEEDDAEEILSKLYELQKKEDLGNKSIIDELVKLNELKDSGAISESEYEELKGAIVNG